MTKSIEDIKISPQALDKRFNKKSVEFLKVIFREMLKRQNKILREIDALLKAHFKAIKIVISLPEHLKSTFRGTGGGS